MNLRDTILRAWLVGMMLGLGGYVDMQARQPAGEPGMSVLEMIPSERSRILYLIMQVTDSTGAAISREDFNNASIRCGERRADSTQWLELQGIYYAEDPAVRGLLRARDSSATHVLAVWADRFRPDSVTGVPRFDREGWEVYQGESRELFIRWDGPDGTLVDQVALTMGTPTNPLNFSSGDANDWAVVLVSGMLIVAVLLSVFSSGVPQAYNMRFRSRHVKRYKELKQPGVRKFDPITSEEFQDEDKVVVKCRVMHHVDSWEFNGGKCVQYPACSYTANDPCRQGEVPPRSKQFFEQHGAFHKLNWAWFGALGGLIAWGLWALIQNLVSDALTDLMVTLTGISSQAAYYLGKDVLTGISLGAGLAFALSWVMERGQSNQLSWLRVFMRTLLGSLAAFAVFMGGYLLFRNVLGQEYLGGLITWLLFGLVLGSILSLRSSIPLVRGLLGGSIAGLVAYNVFVGLSLAFDAYELAKMIAFIVLGALLGLIVETVVTRLEDFELEYIAPAKYARVVPISKWLKSGLEIIVGSDQSNYVFIKWPDMAVQGRHAKLNYSNSKVLLTPLAETLVNGRPLPVNKAYELQANDIIQPGKESVTRMRFIEKQASSNGTTGARRGGAKAGIHLGNQ
ncbi:MAG: hypothetical protein OHK0039_26390 [Bacteroidia bacterium]